MVVVAYELINLVVFASNCYGKILPTIATATFWTSLVSFAVILITVPAATPSYQNARFVFASFSNNTGWSQPGIAFIVGLINPNWTFACLDCATHLAEEVVRPERMIPIAILGTIAIGFVTSWTYSVALFFSVQDLQGLVSTPTGVPVLELFHQALDSKAGAVALEVLVLLTGLGCLAASHTWQARLCWSFARDRGLPGSAFLARIDPVLGVPFRAHLASCVLVAIIGLLYLASVTAFNRYAIDPLRGGGVVVVIVDAGGAAAPPRQPPPPPSCPMENANDWIVWQPRASSCFTSPTPSPSSVYGSADETTSNTARSGSGRLGSLRTLSCVPGHSSR